MKKFYLSLLALICTIGFSASAINLEKSKKVVMPKTYEVAAGTAQTHLVKKAAKKAVASRAGEAFKLEDYEGAYTWTYADLFSQGKQTVDDITITIVDAQANTLQIDGLFGGAKLIGKVDLTTGNISIAPVKVGYNQTYQEDLIFIGCENKGTEENPSFVPVDGDFELTYVNDPEEGVAYISTSLYGLVGRNSAGEYTYADGWYELAQYAILAPSVPWIDCGEAKFYDGSAFLPLVFEDPTVVKEVTVSLQKSPYANEEGVYRLVGPWNKAFESELNNLVFNISNPNCVLIPLQETGITENTLGTSYVMSMSYNIINGAGKTVEEFLTEYGNYNIKVDGNRIDLPIGSFFTVFEKSEKIYYVSEANGGKPGYIILPEGFGESDGVEGIVVDDATAPAEFFNLQGQRVAAPVKGNLYIKRQGAATSKVVF